MHTKNKPSKIKFGALLALTILSGMPFLNRAVEAASAERRDCGQSLGQPRAEIYDTRHNQRNRNCRSE